MAGKLAGVASAAGKAASSFAGSAATKVASGVGAAKSSAIAGAAIGATGAAVNETLGALKTSSILLIIIGLLHYFLRIFLGASNTLSFALSIVLFVVSGYAVSNKVQVDRMAVFIPMIIFWLWWFIFGGNIDVNFLIYFLSITLAILTIPAVFTKGKILNAEAYGLLPVLFLFLDLGLIPFLVENLGLTTTSFLESLILFMPWWAFLGLLMLPTVDGGRRSTIISLVRVLGIIYVIFVFVIPFVPNVGTEVSIPTAYELTQAQQKYLDSSDDCNVNPAKFQFQCFFEFMGEITAGFSMQECKEEKKEEFEITCVCEGEGYESGTSDYESCIKKETEARAEAEGKTVSGTVDSSITKATEASFEIDDDNFPYKSIRTPGQAIRYPITLNVENPREQEIDVKITCNFTNSRTKESFNGVVGPTETGTITDKSDSIVRTCSPPDGTDLNGSYKLYYYADFSNLETTSGLTRMFVEDYDEDNEILSQARKEYFSGNDAYSSSPDEFARINFAFGEPETNPIVELDDNVLLVASIENVASGKITKINSYDINLGFDLTELEDEICLYGDGSNVILPERMSKGTTTSLTVCFLKIDGELASDVSDQGFIVSSYFATLNYNYMIENQENIEVELQPTVS